MSNSRPPNQDNLDNLAAILAIGLVVAAFVAVLAGWVPASDKTIALFIAVFGYMLILFVGMALSVFVHELGHAIGARLARLTILGFDFFFFRIRRKDSGNGYRLMRFKPEPHYPSAAIRIVVGTAVPWQIAVAIAGGPLANLAVAGAGLAISILLGGGLRNIEVALDARDWRGWVNVVAALNLVNGICNLLPLRLKTGFPTDGRQLLDLALGRWTPVRLPAGVAEIGGTFVRPNSPPIDLPRGIRHEFETSEPVAEVRLVAEAEIAMPTCRPPDASIE